MIARRLAAIVFGLILAVIAVNAAPYVVGFFLIVG